MDTSEWILDEDCDAVRDALNQAGGNGKLSTELAKQLSWSLDRLSQAIKKLEAYGSVEMCNVVDMSDGRILTGYRPSEVHYRL